MSDDTPTERFDASPTGGASVPPATPTTPLPTGGPATPPPEEEKKRNRGLLIALIVIGAVLLIAIIVLLILLLGGRTTTAADSTNSPTPTVSVSTAPTPSTTPSSTPSASPTPTATTAPPPPVASGPTLTAFSSSTSVQCNAANNPIPIDFSWTGTGAAAYIAAGATSDPKNNGQGWTLPPTGTQADFPNGGEFDFPCPQASATYSLGVYDNSGHKVVKQLVVKNTGTVG